MNSEKLRILEEHCIGTAESELSFLEKAFFNSGEYNDIVKTPTGSPILLVGKKGTGKSAYLQYMNIKSKEGKIDVLYLKPDDIPSLSSIGSAQDIATIKRIAFESLMDAIEIKVGSKLRGLLGRKDKKLFDKAVSAGVTSKDAIQILAKHLPSIGSPITSINFEKLVPGVENSTLHEIKDALNSNLTKTKNLIFLMIDDVDQVASPNQPNHINRIWGFILAVRKIAEEFTNIKCVISLRTEIWFQLKNDKAGQRDQVDHIKPLIRILDPTEPQIKEIINKRLNVVSEKLNINDTDNAFETFFHKKKVSLPTSDKKRFWIEFIAKSSRQRPRDAIQFMGLLAKESRKENFDIIKEEIVEKAMNIYSQDRFEDLIREFASECPSLENVLKSYSKVQFRLETEDLKDHINSIPSICSVSIRSHILQSQNIDDSFLLWNFMHEIGFLNPCIPDNRKDRDFRHILYSEDMNFVSKNNWNEMQKVTWEIHPAFRSHLIKLRKDDEARSGISLSSFFKKKS